MVQKMTTLEFRSEILHVELINVVYLFCSDLLLFPRKFANIVLDADHYKNGGHYCRKYEHKNFAREKCKSKVAFLQFVYLCAKYLRIIYAQTQDSSSNFEFTVRGRALASHQCGQGSNPGAGVWIEFVVGSLPCCERLFSGYSGFSPLTKNQHFQIPIRPGIR